MYNDDQNSGLFERFFIKFRLAKDASQARNVLVVLTLMFFVLAFYFARNYFLPKRSGRVDTKAFMKIIHEGENQNTSL